MILISSLSLFSCNPKLFPFCISYIKVNDIINKIEYIRLDERSDIISRVF